MDLMKLQNLLNECIMIEQGNYLGGNFSVDLAEAQAELDQAKQLLIPRVVKSLPTTEERDLELNEMLESYFSKNETQPIKDFKFGFKHCFKWIYDKINM